MRTSLAQVGFQEVRHISGRASRSEYWWWALFSFIVYVVLRVPAYVLGIATSSDGGRTPGAAAIPLIILMIIFSLAIIVPNLALTVRRLHDAGYSGWLVLLGLVPYVGGLILLIFTVLPSSPAGVKYDPVPATPPYDNPYQAQASSPPESSYLHSTITHHKGTSESPGTDAGRAESLWPRDKRSSTAVAVRRPGWSHRRCTPPGRE